MLFINPHKIAKKDAHPVSSDIFLVSPTAAKVGISCFVTINIFLRPQGAYILEKNGRKFQSGTLNHRNGRNNVLITYCTGDRLAKLSFC